MTKTLKVILISSLVLNLALVVGFLWFRSYVGSQLHESWVALAEAEQSQWHSILADLESEDPNRVEALEERIRAQIEMGEKNIAMLRQLAQ